MSQFVQPLVISDNVYSYDDGDDDDDDDNNNSAAIRMKTQASRFSLDQ
jgi:hypothetical protein